MRRSTTEQRGTRKLLPGLAAVAALAVQPPRPAAAMTCSFSSVISVSFGNYNVYSSSPVDAAGRLTYLCHTGIASFVTIDFSTGSSGSYTTRTMQKGAATLGYNLYSTAARSGSPWGDGTGGTTHYGPQLVVLGTATDVDIFGRIPALQNVEAGSYADTIVMTISF